MISTHNSASDQGVELTTQPRTRVWFGRASPGGESVDSPFSSGRAFFSHDTGWLNPFSRVPAMPQGDSASFEDVPLDASCVAGNAVAAVQPVDSATACTADGSAMGKPSQRSASDRLREALHVPRAQHAGRCGVGALVQQWTAHQVVMTSGYSPISQAHHTQRNRSQLSSSASRGLEKMLSGGAHLAGRHTFLTLWYPVRPLRSVHSPVHQRAVT